MEDYCSQGSQVYREEPGAEILNDRGSTGESNP